MSRKGNVNVSSSVFGIVFRTKPCQYTCLKLASAMVWFYKGNVSYICHLMLYFEAYLCFLAIKLINLDLGGENQNVLAFTDPAKVTYATVQHVRSRGEISWF